MPTANIFKKSVGIPLKFSLCKIKGTIAATVVNNDCCNSTDNQQLRIVEAIQTTVFKHCASILTGIIVLQKIL